MGLGERESSARMTFFFCVVGGGWALSLEWVRKNCGSMRDDVSPPKKGISTVRY